MDSQSQANPSALTPASLAVGLELWSQSADQHTVPVRGGSMQPTILPGDRLVVAHYTRLPVPGEIVIFQQEDELIAHRILRTSHDASGKLTLLTAGDHSLHLDPPIPGQNVLGTVTAVQRLGRQRKMDGKWWSASSRLVARADWIGICINQAAERTDNKFYYRLALRLTSIAVSLFIHLVQPVRWQTLDEISD